MWLYMTLLPLAQALFLPTSFWALMWKLNERKHLLGTPGRWKACLGVCPLQLGRHSFTHAAIQQPLHTLPLLTRPCTRPGYRGVMACGICPHGDEPGLGGLERRVTGCGHRRPGFMPQLRLLWAGHLVFPNLHFFLVWKWETDQPRQHIKKQRHYFANKGPSSQSYGFSSSHVWMWELDYKESWALKNWCFWTVVLEKILESPLDSKEIKPVNPKGNQSWIFIWRTDAEAPIFWPPDVKNWLLGKDPEAGKDWEQ